MYWSLNGWWGPTLDYMYRRFGFPLGKAWIGKRVNGYLYSAIVPREAESAGMLGPYYGWIMPTYASKFLDWWNNRYLPEILHNFVVKVCGCTPDWTPESFIEQSVERIRAQVGGGQVVCGLIGGVAVSVLAAAAIAQLCPGFGAQIEFESAAGSGNLIYILLLAYAADLIQVNIVRLQAF